MSLLFILLLIAVIGVLAALLSGRAGATMAPATTTRQQFTLPTTPLDSTDVERLRFSVGLRGYRMDEVDAAVDRLRDEIGLLREEAQVRHQELQRLQGRTMVSAPAAPGADHPASTPRLEDPFGTTGRPAAH